MESVKEKMELTNQGLLLESSGSMSDIKATAGHGLLLPADSTLHLKALSESYWAACVNTRRFNIAFLIFIILVL